MEQNKLYKLSLIRRTLNFPMTRPSSSSSRASPRARPLNRGKTCSQSWKWLNSASSSPLYSWKSRHTKLNTQLSHLSLMCFYLFTSSFHFSTYFWNIPDHECGNVLPFGQLHFLRNLLLILVLDVGHREVRSIWTKSLSVHLHRIRTRSSSVIHWGALFHLFLPVPQLLSEPQPENTQHRFREPDRSSSKRTEPFQRVLWSRLLFWLRFLLWSVCIYYCCAFIFYACLPLCLV